MTLMLHPVELFSTIPVACYVRSVRAFALHRPHRQSRRSELLLYTSHTDNPNAPSFCFTSLTSPLLLLRDLSPPRLAVRHFTDIEAAL